MSQTYLFFGGKARGGRAADEHKPELESPDFLGNGGRAEQCNSRGGRRKWALWGGRRFTVSLQNCLRAGMWGPPTWRFAFFVFFKFFGLTLREIIDAPLVHISGTHLCNSQKYINILSTLIIFNNVK